MDIGLLKRICEIPGAPGFEHRIRGFLKEQLEGLVDDISTDAMGNLTAFRKGRQDRRVMLTAHMDEISFIITHIDDEGFLRFIPLGGFDPKTLTAQRVIVHGKEDIIGVMGSKPIHLMKAEERNKAVQIEDFFIDTGLPGEEVKKIVRIGDPVTRERHLIEMGDCFNSKSLDNRISVFILLEALRSLKGKDLPYDTYAVFTVQEEIGIRGAISAAHRINPDFGIVLDTTIAFDVPGAQPHENVTKLGKGVAIKIMDGMTICDPRMVDYLRDRAEAIKVTWQPEILPAGGTDTAAVQRYGKNGAIAGALSIPTRHIHQVIEMVHKQDVQSTIDLLTDALLHLDSGQWQER
ncbi:MAG: M42 family metallopeptidase [Saprospiraceae bacterium]|nr:M42 family metallopeptidase [Saprospiraceae bacterium]